MAAGRASHGGVFSHVSSGGADPIPVPVAAGVYALAGALLSWCAVDAQAIGLDWWRFLLGLGGVLGLSFGLGRLIESLVGSVDARTSGPLASVTLGFVVSAALVALLSLTGMSAGWLALVVGAVGFVGLVLIVMTARARGTVVQMGTRSIEWLTLAVLVRVMTAGSRYVDATGEVARFTQYWDLMFHLAWIKAFIAEGMLIQDNPLMAATPRPSYHPSFDQWAAVTLKGFALPVDPGFYGLVMPVLGVMFVCALMVLVAESTGTSATQYLIPALLLVVAVCGYVLPQGVKELSGLPRAAYFAYNPPAGLAAIAAVTSITWFVRFRRSRATSALLVAAVLAGATVAMKANTALAVGPAFATAVAVYAWRSREWRQAAIAGAAALVSALMFYLPTRGEDTPMAVEIGALSRWAQQTTTEPVSRWIAGLVPSGLVGDVLFLLVFVAFVLVGWLAVPAALGWLASSGSTTRPQTPVSECVPHAYLIGAVAWAFVIGLTVVQVDVGRFSAWNISLHTMLNVYWVALVYAALGLTRLLRLRALSLSGLPLAVCGVVVALLATPLAMRAVESVKHVGGAEIPVGLYRLLGTMQPYVGDREVVAQQFDTELDAWVSGVAGCRVAIERAETQRAYRPSQALPRLAALDALYAAKSSDEVLSAADALDVSYAIIGPDDRTAVRDVGTDVLQSDGWVLVRLP